MTLGSLRHNTLLEQYDPTKDYKRKTPVPWASSIMVTVAVAENLRKYYYRILCENEPVSDAVDPGSFNLLYPKRAEYHNI